MSELDLIQEKIFESRKAEDVPLDVVFMTNDTLDNMMDYMKRNNMIVKDFKLKLEPIDSFLFAGTLYGVELMIYDEDNKQQQLADFIARFAMRSVREPIILVIEDVE